MDRQATTHLIDEEDIPCGLRNAPSKSPQVFVNILWRFLVYEFNIQEGWQRNILLMGRNSCQQNWSWSTVFILYSINVLCSYGNILLISSVTKTCQWMFQYRRLCWHMTKVLLLYTHSNKKFTNLSLTVKQFTELSDYDWTTEHGPLEHKRQVVKYFVVHYSDPHYATQGLKHCKLLTFHIYF